MAQKWKQNAHIAASYVMQQHTTIDQQQNVIDKSTSRNAKYIKNHIAEANPYTMNTYKVGLTSHQTVIRHTGEGHDL